MKTNKRRQKGGDYLFKSLVATGGRMVRLLAVNKQRGRWQTFAVEITRRVL